jgi:hypothetical protein
MTVPKISKAYVRGKATTETENLRVIEAAKAQFSRARPGLAIGSVAELAPYLPNGKLPVSPWDFSSLHPGQHGTQGGNPCCDQIRIDKVKAPSFAREIRLGKSSLPRAIRASNDVARLFH